MTVRAGAAVSSRHPIRSVARSEQRGAGSDERARMFRTLTWRGASLGTMSAPSYTL